MEEYSSNQSRKRTHSSSDEDTPELNNENSNNVEQSGKHPKRKLESSNITKEDISGKGTSLTDPVNTTDSSKSGIKEAPSGDTKLNLSQTRRSLDSDSDEEHFNDDGYVS